ncbi:MAG: hypothetical protein RBR19_02330 [Sedimentisphaerales bacterium]|nr:hypothetical protein [Sedimentisphaerales bacterium]
MDSHTSIHTQRSNARFRLGCRTLVCCLSILLVAAANAPAESQIIELEPGAYTYQHAQLMADAHTRSFGERRPAAVRRPDVCEEELTDLCRHLDSLQEQIQQTEQRLHELSQVTQPGPEPVCVPAYGGDGEIAELNHRRERLAEQANRQAMELRELREHLANRHRQIAAELLAIHEQMQSIERELVDLDRRRQEHMERLAMTQEQLRQIEARLRNLMAEVMGMQRHVAERMEQNDREREAIRHAIERTREEAEQVRTQLEEARRVPEYLPEPMPRRWPMYVPPVPCPTPVPPAPCPTQVVCVPSPDPALQTELRLLREEVTQLRQQFQEAPKRPEVICLNPYAVGSARGYYWPCR